MPWCFYAIIAAEVTIYVVLCIKFGEWVAALFACSYCVAWTIYSVFLNDKFAIISNWLIAMYWYWVYRNKRPPRKKRKVLKAVSDRIKQLIKTMTEVATPQPKPI